MVSSFGAQAPRNTAKRFVETTPKVAAPPATSPLGRLARETLTLLVDGVEVSVEVERQERPRGGCQGYWCCPRCERRCCALFIVEGALACRVCHHLDYRSRHILHPALIRAVKLRRRLGAVPGLLSPLPPRPPRWSRAYYGRLVAELAQQEAIIAGMLDGIVRALKRRKGRLHVPR